MLILGLESINKTHRYIFWSDHYILSREWRVIVDQVQTNNIMVGLWYYNQLGVTD